MMIGIVAIWGLHMASLKTDSRSNLETKALFRANEKLEELRSEAMTDFATLVGGNDTPEPPFQRTWTVTSVNNWQRNVVVVVAWPERIWVRNAPGSTAKTAQNVNRSVQLTSLLVNLN